MANASNLFLIALGSNVRTARDGPPRRVLEAAYEVLEDLGILIHAVSQTITTPPMGPSQRRFANAAAIIETSRRPDQLLAVLKATEHVFGRKTRGQRWNARVLDLDIVLWDGGIWESNSLLIPHPEFRKRDFVLQPATQIGGDWKDPITNLSLAQLYGRLTKPRPVPR
ncbi:2-amino-4-hydroxy-6-hydroxymethyldihydropteridine diphosphokinase [Altererythrobacter ishigakiensis]|uniref:2-amino-4-hydroxy-6-hydroxymethyldihydropteridine pyrophosphokinase n=1 Tax=Altererythrobacter ishigakiensis TaxID=476157 RepID=A0A562UUI6_9SPHN|nr:2-amino-4-hydroxy-6-hydroxymethyldihydropteridine diphosphokinase [Altererythrobacter ishigakiensis]TWJ09286.1 2-amino-4-hydroxy-6-hydroxymethyldihydropteridine diphosphokinase [Altererythrobacter ishigakiensis]